VLELDVGVGLRLVLVLVLGSQRGGRISIPPCRRRGPSAAPGRGAI